MEKSPVDEPSLVSVEYEFEVDGGMNTDDVGLPVLPDGGNELCVGRDGGRFVLPLLLPGFLSKPSKSYCLMIILCMATNVIKNTSRTWNLRRASTRSRIYQAV